MRRSHGIHALPTPVSWALHVAALLVWASADVVDAGGSFFIRREDASSTAPSIGGGFLVDAARHQPSSMRHAFGDAYGDAQLMQEEDVVQAEDDDEQHQLEEVDDADATLAEDDEADQDDEEQQQLVELDDGDAELLEDEDADQDDQGQQQVVEVDDDDAELAEDDEAEEDDEEEQQVVEVDDDDPNGEVVATGDEVIKIDTKDNTVEVDGDNGVDAVLDTASVTDSTGAVKIEDDEKDMVVQVDANDVIKVDNGGNGSDVITIEDDPKDVAVEFKGNDAVNEVISLGTGGADDEVVKVQEAKKDLVVEVDGNNNIDAVITVDSGGENGEAVGNTDGVANANVNSQSPGENVDVDKNANDKGADSGIDDIGDNASGAPTDQDDGENKLQTEIVAAADGQVVTSVDDQKSDEVAKVEADGSRGEVIEPVADDDNASGAAAENEKLSAGDDGKENAEGGAGGVGEDAKHEDEKDEYGEVNDVDVSKGIGSLSHHVRESTYYGRCPCNTGDEYVDFWANAPTTQSGGPPPRGRKFRVKVGQAPVFSFEFALTDLTIQCGGSEAVGRINVSVDAGQPISVKLELADNNSDHHFCGDQAAGFVAVNSWKLAPLPAGPIFVSGTDGFACFKSPQLLRLRDGVMLAFAQARWPSCSESGHSTIVFRRSHDRGVTWSPMAQLVDIDESARNRLGLCGHPLSMSNVVPIDLADQPGRLIVLYMRNNYRVWMIRSKDGGMSWGGDRELPTATPSSTDQAPDCGRTVEWFGAGPGPFTYAKELGKWFVGSCWYRDNNPYAESSEAKRLASRDWQWVGIGPGGAVQLRAGKKKGRILVPGYHSFIRNLDPNTEAYNPTAHFWRNTAETHTLVSDDGGESWQLAEGSVEASNTSRETNFFQLSDGAVYANSATLALGTPQFRTQARVSADAPKARDVKLKKLRFTEIPQPLGGCQGSVVADDDDQVYVSGPDGPVSETVKAVEADIQRCDFNASGRSGLTVWRSVDHGLTFPDAVVVDADLSADSSIQVYGGRVFVLYEQADGFPEYEMYGQRRRLGDMQIFDPDRIMFATLEFPPHTTTTAPPTLPPTTQAPTTSATTTNTPAPTPPPPASHDLVFNPSDGIMDIAYYTSKSECEANRNAVGWYIRESDAGEMLTAGGDCKCHRAVSKVTGGPDTVSIFPCLYQEKGKMAFSIFSGEACTLNEMAQINVATDSVPQLQRGKCVQASVILRGDTGAPTAKYFRAEVGNRGHGKLKVEVKKQQGDGRGGLKKLARFPAVQNGDGRKESKISGRGEARGPLPGKSGYGRRQAKTQQVAGRVEARGGGRGRWGKGRGEGKE